MEEIISDFQNDIFQLKMPYPFIRDLFQPEKSSYDISCYCACRIAVSVMVDCRCYRLAKIITMSKRTEDCYGQSFFSYPAFTKHTDGFPIINLPVICKIDSFPDYT